MLPVAKFGKSVLPSKVTRSMRRGKRSELPDKSSASRRTNDTMAKRNF